MLADFKPEIKLFLIVAAVSVGIAVGGILLLQAGLGPSSPTPTGTVYSDSCAWRPDRTDYGPCEVFWGSYFDGEKCIGIGGCAPHPDVPFSSMEACNSACVSITFPPQAQKVFATQEECEVQTGYHCDFVNCDVNCPAGFQKGWSTTDEKLEQTIDTTSWQTYRNEEFGFEVKYPGDWTLGDDGKGEMLISPKEGQPIDESIRITLIDRSISIPIAERYATLRKIVSPYYGEIPVQQPVQFSEERVAELFTPGYLVVFWFPTDLNEEHEAVFDQILSTFRFVGEETVTPQDPVSCEQQGGTWGQFGAIGTSLCNLPTSDAGQACTSSSQCESACITESFADWGTPITGECYAWTVTLGTCLTYVENGKIDNALCID